jgi:general stress protein 26
MMTSIAADGNFNSRPMLALLRDGDDSLWFITRSPTEKLAEIAKDTRVHLAFMGSNSDFLSVSGHATALRDRAIVAELWHPTYRAWFPDGQNDDTLILLQVLVDRADYWDAPTSRVVRLVGMVKALATGTPYETAERQPIVPAIRLETD